MKFNCARRLGMGMLLATEAFSFTVVPSSLARTMAIKPSTTLRDAVLPDANHSQHHAQVTAAALALAALLWTAHPDPLHEGNRPSVDHLPTLLVSQAPRVEQVVPSLSLHLAKLQIIPTPGFGFGGLGIGPLGVGPFGGLGGGFIIRTVPKNVPQEQQPLELAPRVERQRPTAREQQLEALVRQQQQRLEQYEKLQIPKGHGVT